MSKVCKYGCGVELGQYNTSENKFLETDNKTLHTRDRCESLKQQKVVNDWANEKIIIKNWFTKKNSCKKSYYQLLRIRKQKNNGYKHGYDVYVIKKRTNGIAGIAG